MAILNESLAYLLDPAFQVESVAGKPLVGGYAEVFLAGTNSKVITCQDFDGTNNPFRIPLKNDGRAIILVQPQNHYDIYFYDSYGNLAFSRLNVIPAVGGELHLNGKKLTNIKNDDGTLDVSLNAASQNLNTYTINSNHTPLGVESPLYFKEDTEESVVIGLDESIIDEKVAEAAKGFATSGDIAAAVAAEAQIRATNDNAINQKAEQARETALTVDEYVKAHEGDWSKGTTYTAGANININAQNVISGKDWSGEIAAVGAVAAGKQDKLTNAQLSAISSVSGKQDKLTAGANIKIENNTISVTGEMGKIYTGVGTINVDNTKNEISIDDSGYAKSSDLTGKQDKLTDAQLSAISSVSGKQDKLTAGANIGINGNVISVTGELGKTYTGENYVNVNNDTNKIGLTDTAKNKLDSFVGEFDLSAGENINFRKVGNTVFIDGQQGGGGQTYTAGANIDITNNVIALKDTIDFSGNNTWDPAPGKGTYSHSGFSYSALDQTVVNIGINGFHTDSDYAGPDGGPGKIDLDVSGLVGGAKYGDLGQEPGRYSLTPSGVSGMYRRANYKTESWSFGADGCVIGDPDGGAHVRTTSSNITVYLAPDIVDSSPRATIGADKISVGGNARMPSAYMDVSNVYADWRNVGGSLYKLTDLSGKQDKLTDYTPSVWNAKQDALDWTPTIEDI